jgi:hypothetical protein
MLHADCRRRCRKTAEGVQKTAEQLQKGGGSAMQISYRLAIAAARYLCQRHSVGLYRLVDDLLKDPALLPVFAELGAVEIIGGAPAAPRPGTPEWWRAYSAVKDTVLYLETRGIVKYLSQLEVANWIGRPCGSPTPTHISPPPENSTPTADDVAEDCRRRAENCNKPHPTLQKGGRRRATIDMWL